MKRVKTMILCALMVFVALILLSVRAEEGGGSHYIPGVTASFLDILPGKAGIAVANYFS